MFQESNEFIEWLKKPDNIVPYLPNRVQVTEILSAGGQGIVYRGLVDNQDAAIKIYFPGQVSKRIEREVNALEELRCESIVQLLWSSKLVIRDHELSIVATPFVSGHPLNLLIKQRELTCDELAVIGHDVAMAIEAMWERRIVHRDLKPNNILIRPNGRVCVIDLGVARHLNDSSLTQMGLTWGTIGYLSPEQARATRQLTCKSDVFALGVILVECAMGRHPTRQDQRLLLAMSLHEKLPQQLEDWRHASLLMSMLHPRPTRRPLPASIVDTLAYSIPD